MRPASLLALLLVALPVAAQDEPLVQALSSDKLFARGEYKAVRAAYSAYMERKLAADIKAGLDSDSEDINKFLAENPEVKETLLTAIDPEGDDAEQVFAVFRTLYKLGPEKIKQHPNLAVAVCVVWDNPKAVYDYRGHAVRTKSTYAQEMMKIGAKENYEYLLSQESTLKGVVQHLPWEFLIHVVNNRTPDDEREWAVKNFLKRRQGIGTIYKDIRYDTHMLDTEMRNGPGKGECKLDGQKYTLENIKRYGGVCAHQADFAARVAKSLGVPGEYVRGEGNSGGRHAWVMWVEVKSVTKEKIDFALMSEGRYFGDQYYVGTLENPQTGKEMTDRDMERRLLTIGVQPQNARHADLLMRAYPLVAEAKSMTPKQKFGYIKKVFEVFPHCERAWQELAVLSTDGKTIEPVDAVANANKAFLTFAAHPDFSWSLFDALLTNQKDKTHRATVYEKVVLKYESLGRPDLACEARLKLVEYQAEAKDYKKAAEGLAGTIGKFPAEGRYVPKMLEKLQEMCGLYKEGTKRLAKFYAELLPHVPKTRGDRVSDYAVKLHEQAQAFYSENKMDKEAAAVGQQLGQLKGMKK